jgi:hypothetical protein
LRERADTPSVRTENIDEGVENRKEGKRREEEGSVENFPLPFGTETLNDKSVNTVFETNPYQEAERKSRHPIRCRKTENVDLSTKMEEREISTFPLLLRRKGMKSVGGAERDNI